MASPDRGAHTRVDDGHTVWTSRGAAVGVVSELMDVEPPLGIRFVAGDIVRDLRRAGLALLLKSHRAPDLRVPAKDGN